MPLARGHCGGGARYAFFKVLALRLCIANGLAAGLPCMVYSAARLVPGLCNNTAARWTAYPDSVRCWLESSPATWTPRTRGHIIGGVGVFCEKLKQARLDAGLTQRQAAERAGIAVSQWQDYETGRRVPLVTVAAKLARAVGASLDGLTSTC